ncbi:MAG: DUF1311 domain-containing protein [Ottowia sp.]|nr:DUF1311 domain-containing protein [Ottowia sp.]
MNHHTTRAAALLAAFALCAAPALAQQEEELAPGFDACLKKSGGVTDKMEACSRAAYEYWDKQLNAEYKKVRQACPDDSCRQKLRDMQRHWIQYKESMSGVVYRGIGTEGASMNRLNAVAFEAEETKKQTELLRELLR